MPETADALGGKGLRSFPRWHEIAESAGFRRLEALRRRAMLATLGIFAAISGAFLSGWASSHDLSLAILLTM